MLEKVIRFLLSTTKIRLKKSYNYAVCYLSLSFFVKVAAKEKEGFAHLR